MGTIFATGAGALTSTIGSGTTTAALTGTVVATGATAVVVVVGAVVVIGAVAIGFVAHSFVTMLSERPTSSRILPAVKGIFLNNMLCYFWKVFKGLCFFVMILLISLIFAALDVITVIYCRDICLISMLHMFGQI
jgi:hypothetical protein